MYRKKQIERAHLELFAKLVPDLPDGLMRFDDAPDLCVEGQRTVGIEHKRIFKLPRSGREPEQAFESRCDGVLSEALRLAVEAGLPPVHVDVMFNPLPSMSRASRVELAARLVDFVRTTLPKLGETSFDEIKLGSPIVREVDAVFIRRHRGTDCHRWRATGAGFVVEECQALLQQAIDAKVRKLPGYLERCSECWLLLVGDARRPSGAIHPDGQSLAHRYRSPFDRTYFLDWAEGKLARLKTTPAG